MPGVNSNKVRDSIKRFLEKMKACDEVPEELADDALEMVNGVNEALDEEADILEITKDEEPDLDVKIEDTIRKVLMESGLIKDRSVSALDELEEKLEAMERMSVLRGRNLKSLLLMKTTRRRLLLTLRLSGIPRACLTSFVR